MQEASAMALSLLELVTRAVEEEDGELRKPDSEVDWTIGLQPSVTTSSGVSKGGNIQNDDYVDGLIIRESGEWCVVRPSEEEESLVKLLKKKLENVNFTTSEFLGMVKPVLEIAAKRTGAESTTSEKPLLLSSTESNTSDEVLTLRLLRKAGPVLGRNLSASIVRCSLGLRIWSVMQVLLEHGLVSSVTHPQMVVKLVDERQPLLLCLCLHHVYDLPPSDILVVLKFFLDEANVSRNSFEVVRKDWRAVASSAIARAADSRNISLVSNSENLGYERGNARVENRKLLGAAVAFAAAVDGFIGWEVCLHDLVSAGQDEAVIAAVLRELDTVETMRLLRYLHKWLDRYSRKLAHIPFPPSCKGLPHKVPSLGQVLQWTSALFDVQYTRVVMTSDFFPELSALRALIEPLVAVGAKFSPLAGLIEHIRANGPLPVRKRDTNRDGASDYVIEFLDLS